MSLEVDSITDLSNVSGVLPVANGGSAAAVGKANYQAQPSNPTAPNSTASFTMQGLAGTITPTVTGVVLLIITGSMHSTTVTAGDGILIQASYGTGAAPTTNAALTGTQKGAIIEYANANTVIVADTFVPFTVTVVITGLTLNVATWLDLAAKSVATASSVGLVNVSISAIEI